MESVPTVAIRNLRYGWPKQPSLLCVEAFDIAAGEMVLLQGPSGCGKTTLLGLIAGVIAARPAGVRLLGHELASLGASERDRLRQQQRVAAARALIGAPRLIIADEPTSALDEHQQAEFLSLLIAQTRSSKATLCMVSHQRGFASLFDRTVEFSALNSLGHVV